MYALAALGCLFAIMILPLAGIVVVMAFTLLHLVLLYLVLPILIIRFLWDLFTNPASSFANLVARVRAWGVSRRTVSGRLRSLPRPFAFLRRRSKAAEVPLEAEVAPKAE